MSTALPAFHEAGNPGSWTFTDRHGSVADLEGDFLGMGSSHRPYHKHVFPPYAEPKQHCSTCRWMEVRVFQEAAAPQRYLIVKSGQSIVPGEETITTFGWADSGALVVEALTDWDDAGRASFSFISRRALEQASRYDDAIHDAYKAAQRRVDP